MHGPLRTTIPAVRSNDDIMLTKSQNDILTAHKNYFSNVSYQHPHITGGTNDQYTYLEANFLTKSFVYLITESVGDYPYPYLSEKTWKAISTKMPFMIVGSKGTISYLNELGFKTFAQWWSEDYDNMNTVADRAEFVVLEIKKLSLYDNDYYKKLRIEMEPVLHYNFQHLAVLQQQDLDNIRNNL